jgi:retinol dehydrogenase 12
LYRTELKQETGYNQAEVRILDLASFASVSAFANELEKEDARVDVLVANAAVGIWSYEVTQDGWEQR